MKTQTTILILICLFVIISCSNKEKNIEDADSISMLSASEIPPPPPSSNNQGQYNPKLIKKGELTISSKEIELTKELIYKFAKQCNGYVINENFTNYDYYSSIDISLNIQASYFDLFLKKMDSAKINVVSRIFSVEDITMKYIDDSTRLFNKKKLEGKYLGLLAKTNDIKNLLEIENKLEEIQTDIEVRENQLKVLDKQIAYSEFKIEIKKDDTNLSYEDRNKFTYKIRQGMISGWDGMKSIVIFLLSIWPLYILIILLYFVMKFVIRKRKMKK